MGTGASLLDTDSRRLPSAVRQHQAPPWSSEKCLYWTLTNAKTNDWERHGLNALPRHNVWPNSTRQVTDRYSACTLNYKSPTAFIDYTSGSSGSCRIPMPVHVIANHVRIKDPYPYPGIRTYGYVFQVLVCRQPGPYVRILPRDPYVRMPGSPMPYVRIPAFRTPRSSMWFPSNSYGTTNA
jgi:hypothetical protein